MQPFELRTVINSQSWDWLFDLPHRLNVAIEIVDDRCLPVLPVGSGHTAAVLRQLITTEASPLQSVISNATQSSPHAVAVDGTLCVCFALASAGVLVLARELTEEGEPADKHLPDLERVGSWLAGAVEANLASEPGSAGVESHMIASLQRLLNEAVSRGSVRNVVSAFVETLAVWRDIDVYGYVAGTNGRSFLSVSPLGADQSAMSAELDDAALPADEAMVRVSSSEIERLGLGSIARDVLIRRISTDTGASWRMVFAGTIDSREEPRLTVYSDLLRESLNELTAETIDRVVATILRHLSRSSGTIEATAQLALDEVIAAVGAQQGALAVTTADGEKALAVGNGDLLAASELGAPPDRLVVQSAHDGHSMAVAVAGEGGRFTAHDRGILEAAVALLQPWTRAALQRLDQAERRGSHLPFQAWIERLASETIQEGGHASVILISMPDMALRPGFMQEQVAKIRNQLRPSDFAGNLTAGEIAVLLRDTPADHAAFVRARLQKLLEWDEDAPEGIHPSIGMISCSAESHFDGSIVRAVREDAAARSQA
jgi:hypothetical protein